MDLNQIIQAAAEAALRDQGPAHQAKNKSNNKKRKGLTTPRALLLGAGVFTVGRLVVGSRGRDMLEDLQERLAAYESEHFGSGEQEEDLEEGDEFEEEPEGEFDEDQEPEGEYDEDEGPEGEYEDEEEPEDEPEGEFDEEEPEGEYDEDGEPEDQEDEDEEPEEERPRRRRTSSAGSRNGRH